MSREARHGADPDKGERPSTVARSCTDSLCCLTFLLALGALVGITGYALQHGKLARATGLPDWRGQICGVSESVKEKPFLYVCVDPSKGVDSFRSVCVSACPSQPSLGATQCAAVATVPDYASRPLGGILCMPTDTKLIGDVVQTSFRGPTADLLRKAADLRAWKALLVSACCAVLLGFTYLFFVQYLAVFLFWLSVALAVGCSAALGGVLLYASQNGGTDGLPSTGDSKYDLIAGSVSLGISTILALVVGCKSGSLATATTSLKVAAECIKDLPALLLEPIVSLVIKVAVFVLWLLGLALLLSCVHRTEENGTMSLTYEPIEQVFIGLYLFIGIWVLELCTALSNFVVTFATEEWYFASYHGGSKLLPVFAPLRAYIVGPSYHLGTLAYGAFVVSVAAALRLALQVFAGASQASANPVGECVGKCCACCAGCIEAILRYVTRAAYMDVALNGHGFCEAARHSAAVFMHEATAVVTLRGAAWLFELTGIAAITAGGAALTYLLCVQWPEFADQASEHYVQDPVFLAGVGAVLSFLVSLPFMQVFDLTTDTVLFCIAIDRQRNPFHFHLQAVESEALSSCLPLCRAHVADNLPGKDSPLSGRHPPETMALMRQALRG